MKAGDGHGLRGRAPNFLRQQQPAITDVPSQWTCIHPLTQTKHMCTRAFTRNKTTTAEQRDTSSHWQRAAPTDARGVQLERAARAQTHTICSGRVSGSVGPGFVLLRDHFHTRLPLSNHHKMNPVCFTPLTHKHTCRLPHTHTYLLENSKYIFRTNHRSLSVLEHPRDTRGGLWHIHFPKPLPVFSSSPL